MSNVWGIIGGGFGLYGYLPALVEIGTKRLLIHKRHMLLISSRAELSPYMSNIEPMDSYEEILGRAESLVYAVPPAVQEAYMLKKLSKGYKYLLLEKPLGINPISAENILRRGLEISDSMRIGYTFMYSKWAEKIIEIMTLEEIIECKISWQFNSYHHQKNLITWKTDHGCGGGALRFYGIQLIAIIATFGEVESVVESSLYFDESNDAYKWVAKLVMENGMKIYLELDSQSPKNQFKLLANSICKEYKIDLNGPFDLEPKVGDQDIRVKTLSNLLNSFLNDNNEYYYSYNMINKNWKIIEAKTQFMDMANFRNKNSKICC